LYAHLTGIAGVPDAAPAGSRDNGAGAHITAKIGVEVGAASVPMDGWEKVNRGG